ncbi:hypothetical protein Syun_010843 [Stephania yunnanensis]|uniref:Uncharacterized protein n=1 Tax=Stephania yunnanensis TaxID=152371 RepID=A0AAP0PDX7_9MAGN
MTRVISSSRFNTTSSSSLVEVPPRGPWHSPVPYLFGGLAVMLGLIAFALFILACSYWKLSGFLENDNNNNNNNNNNERDDPEKGDDVVEKSDSSVVLEEKMAVIMAGDDKPTFLATPTMAYYYYSTKKSTSVCVGLGDDNNDNVHERHDR